MIQLNEKYALSMDENEYRLNKWQEVTTTDKDTKVKTSEMKWVPLSRHYPANMTGLKHALYEVARRSVLSKDETVTILEYLTRIDNEITKLNSVLEGLGNSK